MRCNGKETLSLGALLSQSSDPHQTPKQQQQSMLSPLGSLKSIETSSCSKSLPPPPSPTDSVSESNVIASSDTTTNPPTLLQSLKFDVDLDTAEVQSPDNSIWDCFLADQIESSADFMLISSPRRDYMMISNSPRRDYMISSPKREYMISSPKREYMVSSPKRGEYLISSPRREYMVTVTSPKRTSMGMSMNSSIYSHNYGNVHGVQQGYANSSSHISTTSSSYCAKGKSQSPLHKVFNMSSMPSSSPLYSSSSYGHGEAANLALPAMDALLDEYGMYANLKEGCSSVLDQVFDVAGAAAEAEAAVGGMTATLLECLAIPSLNVRYGEQQHLEEGLGVNGGGWIAKAENIGDHHATAAANYHGLLGAVGGCDQSTEQEQDSGMQLVHLLLACGESVAKDDYISARRFLHHLNRIVSPLGDSMQRVASCFADALSARLSPPSVVLPRCSSPKSHCLDTLKIYQTLYQACPYIKFAHFTANQAIFEAFEAEDRVHVIDLDILQGYQWPAFLQALAARPGGPPSLRITGVGYPAELVRETGGHLAELAHSLRVPFEFHPAVADRLEDLKPHMLHRRVGEALAVNSVNRLHRVPGPHLSNLLAMIRDQAPNIVTLVEQEASHNAPHFLGRFLEALHYYSAIFDSLDATFPADSAARAKVEQCIFLPEIRNIVACEGPDRVERHERLERWRKVMEGKGFKGVALSQNAVTQSKILLGLYSCDGYRLTEDRGCLLLGWQDRPIIAASAWRC